MLSKRGELIVADVWDRHDIAKIPLMFTSLNEAADAIVAVGRRLPDSPIQAPGGKSAIAPVEIEGLPAEIDALGQRWGRKVEFHMTVLAAAVIEAARLAWEDVARLTAGRRVGPITVTREVRRVWVSRCGRVPWRL